MPEKKIEFGKLEPGLYIVPTPIGNLEDITLRALRILGSADIIACEDTRMTGQLLKLLDLPKKHFISYHEHNDKARVPQLISAIRDEGRSVALVSDAGMPCISDPGYRLVSAAMEIAVRVIPLPGASALTSALVASGLPTDSFTFLGFPPQKKKRVAFIEKALSYPHTVVLYESPYRIEKLIKEIAAIADPERKICIAREISKAFEEITTGTIDEISAKIPEMTLKGEVVVVIGR